MATAGAVAWPRRAYSSGEGEGPFDGLNATEADSDEVLTPYSTDLVIGDVMMPIPDSVRHPERVPWVVPGSYDAIEGLLGRGASGNGARGENMFFSVSDPLTRYYLRWLCQKELLGQDMCLLGDPGPALRWLVLLYAHLTRREVCVVSLNRDITESDLKQRREIRNGTLVYEDQSAVTAAKEGHLLVLEGLERVERNVLPVINNLLENREMHLDNGAVLIHPARYDSLLRDAIQTRLTTAARTGAAAYSTAAAMAEVRAAAKADLTNMGLLRVSEKFRVVGITVPVPPYDGSPLDPPLRSRFQCLYVRTGLPTMPANTASHLAKPDAQRQDMRLGAIVKLHAAIDAINDTTSAFANTRPSTRARDGGRGRGSPHSRGSSAQGRGTRRETTEENDTANDGTQSSGPAQPIRNLGSFEMGVVARQLHVFPDMPIGEALVRGFPWPLYAEAQSTSTTGGTVNAQEAQKIAEHYRNILAECGIQEPLLLSGCGAEEEAARARSTGRATSPPPSTLSASARTASAQVSAAFKALMGTADGEAEIRAFMANTGLLNRVHHGDDEAEAVTVPAAVSEASNYIVRLENPRLVPCEGTELADQTVCVADAVIATRGGGRGVYSVPVTVGRYAELRLLDRLVHTDAEGEQIHESLEVAERCAGSNMVLTTELYHALQTMLQLHTSRQHMLLVGAPGSGKTALVRELAHLLGYEVEAMHLYADMTNKDLFQRRTTDSQTGNTTWDNAALVDAAIHGRLVVLDGIDKLPPGMLTSLQQLLVDNSVNLFDGTTLKPQEEYAILKEKMSVRDETTGTTMRRATDADMRAMKIFPIHPAFRVIATARPPGWGAASGSSSGGGGGSSGRGSGVFNHDMTTLFGVVMMPEARRVTLEPVLHQVAMREVEAMVDEGLLPESAQASRRSASRVCVEQLLRLREEVAVLRRSDQKIMPLTFRQLLHLVRGAVRFPEQLALSVSNALLVSLMTGVTLAQVTDALHRCGLSSPAHHSQASSASSAARNAASSAPTYETLAMTVGSSPASPRRTYTVRGSPVLVLSRQYTPRESALVPFVTGFHANPVHDTIVAWLAKQYGMGANILLIGNQGVGKNKVVDAFLSHIRVPRHYLQLHRDTTVGSLTLNPTVEGGKVRWEDSPLVKAVQQGHCLVVDEIDKAPVEVVQVLKGLIEDREMRLGDGRRIVDPSLFHKIKATGADTAGLLAIHPDFRIIVLANPPGFPFHGNDFFRECGDLFSSYVMVNPDRASQLQVLEAYAPSLPQPLMVSLIEAFRHLQDGFSQGNLTYPFSLRELIAVVKHLSRFPQDGVYEALNNVFNFDARDENTLRYVRQVLHHYLSAHTAQGAGARLLPLRAGQPRVLVPLPELIAVPYEQTPTEATSHSAAAGLSRLDTMLHLNPAQLREAFRHAAADCPALQFWTQRFTEADFHDRRASADMTASGFTEWLNVRTMPFLDAKNDTVLAVTVTGQYTHARDAGDFVSFLLRRRRCRSGGEAEAEAEAETNRALSAAPDACSDAYVLATVRLPPVPLDTHTQVRSHVTGMDAGSAASLLTWPVGEVHFMDITAAAERAGLDLAAVPPHADHDDDDGAVQLKDFNASTLLEAWERPSGSMHRGDSGLITLRSPTPLPWTSDGDGGRAPSISPPTLLLMQKGKAMLVDVLASPTTVPPLMITTRTSAPHRQQTTTTSETPIQPPSRAAPTMFCLRGALLPIAWGHLAKTDSDSSATDTSVALSGTFSPAGLLWHVPGSSNTLRVLSEGCVVSVVAPLPLVHVRFVSAQVAAVTMRNISPVSSADALRYAVLRVTVQAATGAVQADLTPLPRSLAETMDVVDSLPETAPTLALAAGTDTSAASDTTNALRGLILTPRGDGAASSSAAFMVIQNAEADVVKLRLYPADEHTGRGGAVLGVDSVHHQMVKPGGVVIDSASATVRQLASTPFGDQDSALWSVNAAQNAAVAYAPTTRQLSLADLDVERVQRRYADWSAMMTGNAGHVGDGADPDSEKRLKPFNMEYSTPRKQPSGTLKHGEMDDKEHHGGNTWAGGTGGTDTAGLGGLIGPYRLDKGNAVHQVSPEEKRKVPKHLIEEARRMGKEALKERLAAIGMSEEEYAQYNQLQERVRSSISQLRTLFMGLKAAEGERTWLKGQSDGVWDDKKLVEGIVGEKNVYKRRVDSKDANPFLQKHKKRVVFVLDVSASMYRFEGMDHRLTKLIESTIMVMEAFAGFESKIDYCLMGHNGDSEALELVGFGQPPVNQRERMEVCMKMIAYAQYCWSGDNTVEAMRHSLDVVTKEKGDSYFVFVISDANLRQYGITPHELSSIILSRKPEVQMFCIFIATLGAQASQLQKQLPAGHGYECMQTDELPHILRKIFSSVNLL